MGDKGEGSAESRPRENFAVGMGRGERGEDESSFFQDLRMLTRLFRFADSS